MINIGNWFADNAEDFTEKLVGILGFLTIIGLCIWVISVFASEGFLSGVLSVFGACLIGSGLFMAIGIFGWILGIMLLALRFVFRNIYTLLLTLAIVGFLCFRSCGSSHSSYSESTPTEVYALPATTTYVCTARTSLKVRRYPSVNAPQIGSLVHGEEIEVLDISDGFAHIQLNGQDGYASTKYLKKK